MRFLYLLLALLIAQPAYATIIPSIPYNLTNGSLADATQVMGNFNTIVSDVNTSAATAGANTNITSLLGLTTPLLPSVGGTVVYTGGTTGGTANAQTLAILVPVGFSLTPGNIVTGIAGATNTGATTLNANNTGVTAVRKETSSGLAALSGGEIVIGQPYVFYYDGTYFDIASATSPSLATSSAPGIVQPDGTIITVSSGAITVAKASSSTFGVAEVDNSTLTASAGVLSCATGTTSQLGCLKPDGSTITASGGTISAVAQPPIMTAHGVGSITLAAYSGGAVAPGTQIAGSALVEQAGNGTGTGGTLTGTWQSLQTYVGLNEAELWQRVN